MGFSRQGYWSGLPFPFPGDLPRPGIKPAYPALQMDCLICWAIREARKPLAVVFLHNFYQGEEVPTFPSILRVFFFFSWMGIRFYHMLFLHQMIRSYDLKKLYWCGRVNWFYTVESGLSAWINPSWLWCIILFVFYWIWYANVLLSIFAICVDGRNWSVVFFSFFSPPFFLSFFWFWC